MTRVVTREQILDAVWEGTFVNDEVLTTAVRKLRQALGDGTADNGFIHTIPRTGYRLNATIEPVREEKHAPKRTLPWVSLFVIAAVALPAYLLHRNANVRWAREEALPEIDRLAEEGQYVAAFALAEEAEEIIPTDPTSCRAVGQDLRESVDPFKLRGRKRVSQAIRGR